MNEEEFDYLLDRYIKDKITKEELNVFLDYASSLENSVLSDKIDKVLATSDQHEAGMVKPLLRAKRRSGRYAVYAAAASLALFLAFFIFLKQDALKDSDRLATSPANDIVLGDSAVMVRTADGQVGTLDKQDSIYSLGSLRISLGSNGEIQYAFAMETEGNNGEITIRIPKGRTSYLQMSDKSKVWLNSNSEIKFKPQFSGSNRIVKLSGEAYFEVYHDKSRPFIVNTESHDVQVLGTAFNVSSYAGMRPHTTLVDGAVRINHESAQTILRPSQQFSVTEDGVGRLMRVETEEFTSWKEGHFVFNKMHLKEIIQYLSNWYPIKEVKVEKWTDDIFTGVFKREKSLKSILTQLSETSSYEFGIEDGTLIISASK